MSKTRYLLARTGDALCALPLGQIRHVARGLTVHGLPGASPELRGLAEFAGEPLPVLELARLVGGTGGSIAAAVTIVARLGRGEPAEIVGLHADEALEIVDLEPPAPSAGVHGVVLGEALAGERRVAVLDLAAWEPRA